MPVCPTCLGDGKGVVGCARVNQRDREFCRCGKCPSCSGRGWVLDEKALEKAAEALKRARFGEPQDFASELADQQIDLTEEARAAVLAYIEHKEE